MDRGQVQPEEGYACASNARRLCDTLQVERAVTALVKYAEHKKQGKTTQDLLDDDAEIQLIVTLKKIPEQHRTKPYPLYAPRHARARRRHHHRHAPSRTPPRTPTHSQISLDAPRPLADCASVSAESLGHRPIPHSLYAEGCEICIFTKDPQKEYRAKINELAIPSIAKVCALSAVAFLQSVGCLCTGHCACHVQLRLRGRLSAYACALRHR